MFPEHLSDPSLPMAMKIATRAEDEDFRALLNEVPMCKGELALRTDLPSPVAENLRDDRQGHTVPILFEDSGGGKFGCASFTVWDGEASRNVGLSPEHPDSHVGYFGDLRISPRSPRDIRTHWRDVYRAWIELLHSPRSPVKFDAIVTSVLDENRIAVRALARGRGGVFYVPVYSYTSLSLMLEPVSPSRALECATKTLGDLGVSHAFRNPSRSWIVETAGASPRRLPYFSLAKLEGIETLSSADRQTAWAAVLDLAHGWSETHERPLFQTAAIGARPDFWDHSTPSGAQRWESPATLYRVATDPCEPSDLRVRENGFIDPSQL